MVNVSLLFVFHCAGSKGKQQTWTILEGRNGKEKASKTDHEQSHSMACRKAKTSLIFPRKCPQFLSLHPHCIFSSIDKVPEGRVLKISFKFILFYWLHSYQFPRLFQPSWNGHGEWSRQGLATELPGNDSNWKLLFMGTSCRNGSLGLSFPIPAPSPSCEQNPKRTRVTKKSPRPVGIIAYRCVGGNTVCQNYFQVDRFSQLPQLL